jgi:hypothetical protein
MQSLEQDLLARCLHLSLVEEWPSVVRDETLTGKRG